MAYKWAILSTFYSYVQRLEGYHGVPMFSRLRQAIEIVWETVEFTGNTVTSRDGGWHGASWGEEPQL